MNKFLLVLILLLSSFQAIAVDRVQLVQSKLQSALSAILPRTDYLIVVNRLDALADGGASQVVDGSVKVLPGINLGVDSKGDLIQQGISGSSYLGAVSIHVLIDSEVKAGTYKTIQKMLPEIVGGLQDNDELKISQSPLRQPALPNSQAPQITIQNQAEPRNHMQENFKFLAALLVMGGLFFWLLSRLKQPLQNEPRPVNADKSKDDAPDSMKAREVNPSDFSVLEPEAVALFLLKEVTDKNEVILSKWIKCAPATHQREVFKCLPAWVLTYLQDLGAKKKFDDQDLKQVTLHDLFNEMALIEQSFKNPIQKKKAFLLWFPAESLRYVPRKHQTSFSERSKKTLWALRPDLGNFVKVDGMAVEEMMKEPTDDDIESCAQELHSFPTNTYEKENKGGHDLVSKWIYLINQLSEFSPIDSQLEQAQAKLPLEDYTRLLHSVAHRETPFEMSEEQRKDWLRNIEPEDYYWWLFLVKKTPHWDLQNDLRPMRLVMFQQVEKSNVIEKWSEEERKQSSKRILTGFREMKKPSGTRLDREAA